jgi:hypothetical protein
VWPKANLVEQVTGLNDSVGIVTNYWLQSHDYLDGLNVVCDGMKIYVITVFSKQVN